jgi:hypothetical protein
VRSFAFGALSSHNVEIESSISRVDSCSTGNSFTRTPPLVMLMLERLTFERANTRALKCFLYVVSSRVSRRCECVEMNECCSRSEVLGLSHHAVACGCVSRLYSSPVAVLRFMVAPAVSAECRLLAYDTRCVDRAMSRCSRRRNSEVSDHLGTASIASVCGVLYESTGKKVSQERLPRPWQGSQPHLLVECA